jgi:protein O-GlcNAc transferase
MAQLTIQQGFDLAVRHHQAGRLQEAERLYRQILLQQPKHAGAMHYLGLTANQQGRNDIAVDLIRRAIALRPIWAEAHYNLGVALKDKGQLDEAIAAFRQAVALKPNYAEANHNLGSALRDTGQLDEAIAAYRQAIVLRPDYAEAHSNLGNALKDTGQLDEAIAACRRAIALNPNSPEAHNNLGSALKDTGQLDEAIAAYRQAFALRPNYAEAYSNLGNALGVKGQLDEAIAACRRGVALDPNLAEAHNNLGSALKDNGQLVEAIAAYRQAIALNPNLPEAHNNLGNALKDKGQLDEAIAAYRQTIALNPKLPEPHNNLGSALMDRGQLDEAIAACRQAIALRPSYAKAHGNLIFAMHTHPAYDAKAIAEEQRHWNRQHAEPLRKFIQVYCNNPSRDRRLRIGYVSPDFRDHVVGRNLLPLFLHHDRRQFEITCYAHVLCPDAMTGQFQQNSDGWRNIVGLSDDQVADRIRQDEIDILVDLALHTANNRLLVFARKPAPVQVTYLGYCAGTGLEAIDYRLSDPHLDPADSDSSVYSERTFLLPETYWCYTTRDVTPEVSPSPAASAGYVTFGCLNNFAKASLPAQDLWAQILKIVPRSRLIVHCFPGAHREAMRERFAGKGVSPDRLEFLGKQSWAQYTGTYGRIDIALDPFPWGGGVTTCDAIWMGVAVVSLAGGTAVGRGGKSILTNIGLPELIARTPEQYVHIAAALAGDFPRLAELRGILRQRIQGSPLMDAPKFARNIEAAYREMWNNWRQTAAAKR